MTYAHIYGSGVHRTLAGRTLTRPLPPSPALSLSRLVSPSPTLARLLLPSPSPPLAQVRTLAERTGVAVDELRTLLAEWDRLHAGAIAWIQQAKSECRRAGYVETLSRRRRCAPRRDPNP